MASYVDHQLFSHLKERDVPLLRKGQAKAQDIPSVVPVHRLGLAAEMRSGVVQVLNDGLLFDRALESIISNLRVKTPNQPSA